MKQTNALRRSFAPVLAVVFLVLMVVGVNQVEAASNYTVTLPESGGSSSTYSKDPTFLLESSHGWITVSKPSPSTFTIKASKNSTGKGRIGYVYVKRQGTTVATYKVIQPVTASVNVGTAQGNGPSYEKKSNQSVTRSGSWITLYQPNSSVFRIDYSANTTGSSRTGYVYVKEGSTILTTYKVTQSASVTVTYDKNGGTGSNYSRSVTYGKTYGKVDNPTRTGYNFAGWYTAKSGGSQVTETTKMQQTTNHTLYARWSPKTFTVSFNSQGGSTVSSKTVSYDSTYGSLSNPTKSGYTFAGWYTAASGGTQVTSSTKVALTANQVLYAHWTANNYTLSFNSQGGSSVSAKTVTFGSKYGTLSSPTKTGYTFAGWYTAASGGSQVTSSTTVSTAANHTVYAHWTANTYTVTYDKNGGSGDNFTRSIAYGSTYGKVDNPSRTGYTFTGWYTAKSGGSQVTESTIMSTAGNHTLYARWEAKTYTITFISNGGTTVPSKTVTYDGTYGALTSPTKTYYTFAGWFTSSSGGTQITSSTKVTITANQTLYAHWNERKYTVTYDKNGGSGDSFNRSIVLGSAYGKVDNPSRDGYTFTGWYTAKSDGSQVIDTTIMKTEANHTLYAHWSPNTYNVSFSSQGGGTVSSKTVTYDSTYGTLDEPQKGGYTFAGWFTASSGGTQVTASTKVTITANQALYAHWTANKYTLSFNSQGGSSISAKTVTYGSKYGTLNSSSKSGYTFAGWFTAASGGSQVTEATTVSTASNHTVYAHWTANKYTVTYDKNGGSGSNLIRSIAYGSAYGKVDDPTRDEYEFLGWYTSKTDGNQVTETTIMSTAANHTVYARWKAKKYTVSFDSQGGSAVSSKSVAYNCFYETLPVSAKKGYIFDGWYTAANGGYQVTASTTMTAKYDHTLYAHWTAKRFTVFFSSEGGSTVDSKTVTYGGTYGILPVPTYKGHTFVGWYTSISGGSPITSDTTVSVTNNQTLYARWTVNQTITVKIEGVIEPYLPYTVTVGEAFGTLPPTPHYSPKGQEYSFIGWFTEEEGGSKITTATIVPSSITTIYAQWKPNTYPVSFDCNGGTDGPDDQIKTFGENLIISSVTPRRPGYIFKGWATPDSNGFVVYPSDKNNIYRENKPLDLTAVWEEKITKIIYHLSDTITETKLYFSVRLNLWNPPRAVSKMDTLDKTFLGWATCSNGAKEYYSDNHVEDVVAFPGETVDLYAVWYTPSVLTYSYDARGDLREVFSGDHQQLEWSGLDIIMGYGGKLPTFGKVVGLQYTDLPTWAHLRPASKSELEIQCDPWFSPALGSKDITRQGSFDITISLEDGTASTYKINLVQYRPIGYMEPDGGDAYPRLEREYRTFIERGGNLTIEQYYNMDGSNIRVSSSGALFLIDRDLSFCYKESDRVYYELAHLYQGNRFTLQLGYDYKYLNLFQEDRFTPKLTYDYKKMYICCNVRYLGLVHTIPYDYYNMGTVTSELWICTSSTADSYVNWDTAKDFADQEMIKSISLQIEDANQNVSFSRSYGGADGFTVKYITAAEYVRKTALNVGQIAVDGITIFGSGKEKKAFTVVTKGASYGMDWTETFFDVEEEKTIEGAEEVVKNTGMSEVVGELLGVEVHGIKLFTVGEKVYAAIDIKDQILDIWDDTKELLNGKTSTTLSSADVSIIEDEDSGRSYVQYDLDTPMILHDAIFQTGYNCKDCSESGHKWHEIYTIYMGDEPEPYVFECIDGKFVSGR